VKDPRPGDSLGAPSNRDGNQLNIVGDRYGWIVAVLIALMAIVIGVLLWGDVRSMRGDLENIRNLIENSADAASASARDAALAAERASMSERHSAISEVYTKQVYVELNRLGYPVRSPAEEHEPDPPGVAPQ
jgi:hypothetical protein